MSTGAWVVSVLSQQSVGATGSGEESVAPILNQPPVTLTTWTQIKVTILEMWRFFHQFLWLPLKFYSDWGWFGIENQLWAGLEREQEAPRASIAVLGFIRAGQNRRLVYSSPLALLLLCVLAQEGGDLLLVVKWTGLESGPQPSPVLEMRGTDLERNCSLSTFHCFRIR